jgi:hypothetical protein
VLRGVDCRPGDQLQEWRTVGLMSGHEEDMSPWLHQGALQRASVGQEGWVNTLLFVSVCMCYVFSL